MLQIHQDRAGVLAAPVSGTIYEGRVARIHPDDDPLRYPWGNEARDAAGLQEICDQLQTVKSFTLLHPTDLISNGAKADIVGQVIGARIDGDHVVARILVTDPRAVEAIRDGMHELSLGYTSRLDATGCQRDIRVDHLALVPRARCGASCSLRADCAGECTCNNQAKRYTTVTVGDRATQDATLTAAMRHHLPSEMFAVPGREALPLEDESHVRDAMARFNQEHFKGPAERKAAYHHIIARAHQLGIDPQGFQKKFANMDEGTPQMDELTKKLTEALAEVAAQKARADALDAQLAPLRENLTKAEVAATNARAELVTQKTASDAALAAERAKVNAAETAAKVAIEKSKLDAAADLTAAVKTRVAIETAANRILGTHDAEGKVIDRSAMSAQEIQCAVVLHVDGITLPSGKQDAFYEGVFEGAVGRAKNAAASVAATRETLSAPPTRQDGAPVVPLAPGRIVPTGPQAEFAARKEMADRKRAGRA